MKIIIIKTDMATQAADRNSGTQWTLCRMELCCPPLAMEPNTETQSKGLIIFDKVSDITSQSLFNRGFKRVKYICMDIHFAVFNVNI